MLPLLALLVPLANAGDQALYERALQLIDDHYLRPESLSRAQMFADAGDQLEAHIEWLLVDASPRALNLRDGQGDWHADVRLAGDADLPAALSRLEDAVHAAGLPIEPDVDVRVEILRGIAKTLDRHSVVLHADGLERFDERLSGTLTGVGATISIDDGGLYVRDVIADGPAARGGLHADDRLVAIDGVSTVGMVPSDATDRIRGTAGTDVVLTIRRGTEERTLLLRRAEIPIRNVTATRGPHDVGVITIEHFSEQTRTYLLEGLAELSEQGLLANGLVIDLRGNTGGSLIQSAQAADTFLQAGLIVSTVGRGGAPVAGLVPRIEAHAENPGYPVPIAVLMDHSTASGSEILAGALAHLDRALLIGTNSFGKGTVQKVYQLDPAIKLKLTVAEYLLDGGTHVVDVGLQPDLALEEVRFEDDGVWFPSPARERRRLPAGTPILHLVGTGDRELELATAIVAASAGGSRADLLTATASLTPRLSADEDTRVVEAFKARGIDWAAAPGPATGEPLVDVRWSFSNPPTAGQVTEMQVTLTNRGPTLHRAALRLSSVDPLWDDVVLPLGLVEHGASRTASTRVVLAAGLPARTDRVGVTLEADRRTAVALPAQDITTIGVPLPPLGVTARAWATGTVGELRIAVDVENHSDRFLNTLQARFDFPKVDGIELVDAESAKVSVAARGTAHLDLRIKVSETWTGATLPLDLTVAGDGYPRLLDWHVELPRGGAPVRLEAPSIVLTAPPTVLPTGATHLRVRATDDRGLDHVLVFAGQESVDRTRTQAVVDFDRDKVAWRSTTAKHTELDVVVPVVPGTNHYVVVAEDRTGLRSQRDVYVLGDDGGAGVSALPD